MWPEPRGEAARVCALFWIAGPYLQGPYVTRFFLSIVTTRLRFCRPSAQPGCFKIFNCLRGEWGMGARFPWLTKVVIRVLEIAGAGLTSALVAYLLGRTDAPAPPPPPQVPAVVHLAPADEEMIRSVRNDQAALLDQLRNETQKAQVDQPRSEAQKTQADGLRNEAEKALAALEAHATDKPPATDKAPAADNQTANAAAKPTKPAQGNAQTVARRDPKPERARPAEAKPRVEAKVEPHAVEQRVER